MIAFYGLVVTFIGLGLGPTSVALLTDHVLRNEHQIGLSLACAVVCIHRPGGADRMVSPAPLQRKPRTTGGNTYPLTVCSRHATLTLSASTLGAVPTGRIRLVLAGRRRTALDFQSEEADRHLRLVARLINERRQTRPHPAGCRRIEEAGLAQVDRPRRATGDRFARGVVLTGRGRLAGTYADVLRTRPRSPQRRSSRRLAPRSAGPLLDDLMLPRRGVRLLGVSLSSLHPVHRSVITEQRLGSAEA